MTADVVRERFPRAEDVAAEARRPVPPIPHRPGGVGMTRLELLLLHVRAGRRT